jgi:hypothetical protein
MGNYYNDSPRKVFFLPSGRHLISFRQSSPEAPDGGMDGIVGAMRAQALVEGLMAVAWGGELRRNEVAGRIVLELQQRRNSWICAR